MFKRSSEELTVDESGCVLMIVMTSVVIVICKVAEIPMRAKPTYNDLSEHCLYHAF